MKPLKINLFVFLFSAPHAAAPQPQYQAAPQYHQPQQQQGFNYQNGGPAVFPPAPPRQQQYYPRPAYSQSQPQYQAYDDQEDYDEPQDPNKPHNFGDGYSFQFAG